MRLKTKEIRACRARILKEQKGLCSLCGTLIDQGDDTLDHDHGTGHIRRVLHRSCNQTEGRILSWIRRCRATNELDFLQNLLNYWLTDYSNMPYHPSHLTENEKEIRKLRKRMKKLKRAKTKQRYKERINKLKEQK